MLTLLLEHLSFVSQQICLPFYKLGYGVNESGFITWEYLHFPTFHLSLPLNYFFRLRLMRSIFWLNRHLSLVIKVKTVYRYCYSFPIVLSNTRSIRKKGNLKPIWFQFYDTFWIFFFLFVYFLCQHLASWPQLNFYYFCRYFNISLPASWSDLMVSIS